VLEGSQSPPLPTAVEICVANIDSWDYPDIRRRCDVPANHGQNDAVASSEVPYEQSNESNMLECLYCRLRPVRSRTCSVYLTVKIVEGKTRIPRSCHLW
jgi:hypothetical protein